MNVSSDLQKRAARIKLLLMDVDGVLTDGRLINVPAPDGSIFESKAFDSQDGIALQWLSWHGIATGVISGRVSPATAERARQVSMRYVYQGHIEKVPILQEILPKAASRLTKPRMRGTISPTSLSCAGWVWASRPPMRGPRSSAQRTASPLLPAARELSGRLLSSCCKLRVAGRIS